MNYKRIFWAGIAINFASFPVGGGSYFLFRNIFTLEPTFVWKWTPAMGTSIPVSWPILLILNIVLAFVFAGVYAALEKGLPGRGVQKGIFFGLIAWLIGVIPPMLTLYLMTVIAPGALWYFTFQGLVEWLVYGVIISAVYRTRGV